MSSSPIRATLRKFSNEVNGPRDGMTFLSRMVVPVDPQARRLRSWLWGTLPRVDLEDVFPGVREVDVSLIRALDRQPGTSVSLDELSVLVAIARVTQARNILEVGTYNGNTALNLAANTDDDAVVTTIDLPLDSSRDSAQDLHLPVPSYHVNITGRSTVGSQYRGTKYEGKIRQIYGDSAALDWSTFLPGDLDLAFIDGCHHRNYVQADTENALRYLGAHGVVVWHDYAYVKDVSDYVDEVAEQGDLDVYAIGGTRLALGVLSGAGT